jgi:5-formyltetrahydrofolate cyclo-ligase
MASLNKEELRRTARAVRDGLSCERHKEAVERVAAQLVELSELRSARRVLVYATLPGELNCLRWLEEGTVLGSPTGETRTVPSLVWPRVAGSELTLHACTEAELIPGSFGLSEPPADAPLVALSDIDVALVPGLAFDAQGYRIGYGKGYYDRLLADAPAGLLTIGLCFKEVYYPEIAHDAYDIPVRRVVRG